MPGWRPVMRPGPRMVALCGLGGAGKTSVAVEYAHRHLAEVGVAWQFPAEDPAVLAAGFGELAAQLGARDLAGCAGPGGVGARGAGRLSRRSGCWCSTTRRTGPRWQAFLPPAGPGRVLITSQNPIWPPGQALEVPVLDTEVAAEFLVSRTGDPDRQAAAGAGRRAGRAAAGAGAGRRVHPGHRGHPGRVPGLVPAAAGRTCWPAASPPGTARRWPPPGRWRSTGCEQAAPGAAGLLRLLAFLRARGDPAAPAAATPPGPGRAARPGGGAGAGAAAGGPAGGRGRDRGAAPVFAGHPGRRTGRCRCTGWSRPSPLDQMPAELARQWRQAAAALIEAAIPADTEPAGDLAGMRGAAAARPGGSCR